MDDEQNAASQLGGLALGNVLRDLGIDTQHPSDLHRLGIASANTVLKSEEIYDHRFFDDDEEDNDQYGDARNAHDRASTRPLGTSNRANGGAKDWEREVDDEMRRELAQERDSEERAALDRYYRQGMAQLEKPTTRLRGEDDDFDDDDDGDGDVQRGQDHQGDDDDADDVPLSRQQQQQPGRAAGIVLPTGAKSPQPRTPPPQQPPTRAPLIDIDEVRRLFPDFDPDRVLNFTDLFATRPAKKRKLAAKPAQFHLQPDDELPVPQSTRELLLLRTTRSTPQEPPLVSQLTNDLVNAARAPGDEADSDEGGIEIISTAGVASAAKSAAARRSRPKLAMVELDDWEERIAWGNAERVPEDQQQQLLPSADGDEALSYDSASLVLDMNDPQMMLEEDTGPKAKHTSLFRADAPSQTAVEQRGAAAGSRPTAEMDPFNLSNDRFYEQAREHRQRVRQTLGKLVVQHAWPATKLQLPWYKTKLTKAEARSFHRPAMQFPTNMPLTFSKTRSSKKKKDGSGNAKKAKDPNEVLRTTRDLTLKDTGPYVLYEYSEEYPPLLSNLGMGSLLVNYYRKKSPQDEHIPKLDIGEPYVLDVADESPFMKFGNIEAGKVQPTLYNNLVRAPLFRHKPAHTDFLLIRSTTKNEIRYYLREIKNLFVVGQTYPIQPIPGPHARLVTNNIKYRLQMIAYKLIQKSYRQRIKIHRLMRYFPDQNELQMRQRLKEFMEYNRKAGDVNQGFWKLKPHIVVPDEQELFKLLPPEHIALAESMQVGQRHLLDAGYTKSAEGADEDGDESKMDIEQLLAPWITSKNFINATQGKAMLKLHGPGDPTGRGEAFSFIRVSMKEIFLRAGEDADERMAQAEAEAKSKSGHKYSVAEQQAVYRSEVDRIWNAQCRSLSNPVPPELTPEDEKGPFLGGGARGHGRAQSRADSIRRDRSPSRVSTPGPGGEGQDGGEGSRVLCIRRLVNGKWQKEIVRDAAVINAYVTQRKKIEDEMIATEDLVPTGDDAIDASRMKRLQEELAQRKKNQERRIQRKNAKAAAEGLAIPGGYKKLLNKTDTKRRCGRCGEVGHIGFFGPGVGMGMGVGLGPPSAAQSPMSSIPPSPMVQTPGGGGGGGGGGGSGAGAATAAAGGYGGMMAGGDASSPAASGSAQSPPSSSGGGGGLKLKLRSYRSRRRDRLRGGGRDRPGQIRPGHVTSLASLIPFCWVTHCTGIVFHCNSSVTLLHRRWFDRRRCVVERERWL
ncbi:related to TAF1 - TFIID subunit (TBP-associated factor), 145 kD [Pseudozyma flocculosa]|uniref:Related to TAF1 - TFIID subunit (TBP-associated factor), 145 kD n=1 Tax=Pseudozyma flocculosa TaxID=84751 RepID=A0A5C3FAV0_9BASI|nr:related to TAF1 - TFIID subunit (TBP-associated factor), 145 kD [Pseudozyma flocculosa]